MSRGTLDPALLLSVSPTGLSPSLAGLSRTVPLQSEVINAVRTPECTHSGLGSFHFARRYFENRVFFLFLRLLRCFSSPGHLLYGYLFTIRYIHITVCGFPHSDISGSLLTYSSPKHFVVSHVLHRLLVPRHPPCALINLTLFLVLRPKLFKYLQRFGLFSCYYLYVFNYIWNLI